MASYPRETIEREDCSIAPTVTERGERTTFREADASGRIAAPASSEDRELARGATAIRVNETECSAGIGARNGVTTTASSELGRSTFATAWIPKRTASAARNRKPPINPPRTRTLRDINRESARIRLGLSDSITSSPERRKSAEVSKGPTADASGPHEYAADVVEFRRAARARCAASKS